MAEGARNVTRHAERVLWIAALALVLAIAVERAFVAHRLCDLMPPEPARTYLFDGYRPMPTEPCAWSEIGPKHKVNIWNSVCDTLPPAVPQGVTVGPNTP